MALINCPECNNPMSDKARQCPHCGLPSSQIVICPECHTVMKRGLDDCPKCGYYFKVPVQRIKPDTLPSPEIAYDPSEPIVAKVAHSYNEPGILWFNLQRHCIVWLLFAFSLILLIGSFGSSHRNHLPYEPLIQALFAIQTLIYLLCGFGMLQNKKWATLIYIWTFPIATFLFFMLSIIDATLKTPYPLEAAIICIIIFAIIIFLPPLLNLRYFSKRWQYFD